jgi:hypothetical protein
VAPDHADAAWDKGLAYWYLEGQLDTLRAMAEGTPGMPNRRRLVLRLYERDGEGALAFLEPGPDSVKLAQYWVRTKSLYSAWVHQVRGDEPAAVAAFDSARVLLEAYARENPDDYRVHNGLGHAYAGLGRRADASHSAEQYIASGEGDHLATINIARYATEIFASAGLADEAVEYLEPLLEGPGGWSVNRLRTHWFYDPIRDHPRFQALLETYAEDVEH